jgi:hypothetical protein
LTAALYAGRKGVVNTIRETGKLPKTISTGGSDIGGRLIIEERGEDISLSEDEQLVYDAILRENRLPGGSVILITEELKYQAQKKRKPEKKDHQKYFIRILFFIEYVSSSCKGILKTG